MTHFHHKKLAYWRLCWCDGPLKPKAMVEFLQRDYVMIENHNGLIEEQDSFEEDSNFDFLKFQIQVFFHPQFALFLLT